MVNDELAIRNLVATWCRETEAGNLNGILPLMADDVVFLTPGQPPFGKREFAEGFRGMVGKVRIRVHSEIEEIQIAGDWAWCRTRLAVTITPIGGGAAVEKSGYALGIYRCDEGRWMLARDANLVA